MKKKLDKWKQTPKKWQEWSQMNSDLSRSSEVRNRRYRLRGSHVHVAADSQFIRICFQSLMFWKNNYASI